MIPLLEITMDTAQHSRVIKVAWLAASPNGPHAIAFKRHLTERRYAAHTVASYLAEVTPFAHWVCTRRLPLARIDEISVAIFLDDHRPSCACTGHTRHDRADHSAALGHLLVVLRAQGAIAQPPVSTTPVDEELRRYDDHMNHLHGLAPKSRTMGLRIVGRLELERPKTSNRAIFVRNVAQRDTPSARISSALPSARLTRAPGCRTPVRTCCATRWPTVCSPAARP